MPQLNMLRLQKTCKKTLLKIMFVRGPVRASTWQRVSKSGTRDYIYLFSDHHALLGPGCSKNLNSLSMYCFVAQAAKTVPVNTKINLLVEYSPEQQNQLLRQDHVQGQNEKSTAGGADAGPTDEPLAYIDQFILKYLKSPISETQMMYVDIRHQTLIQQYINVLRSITSAVEQALELDPEDPLKAYRFVYNHSSLFVKGESISDDLKRLAIQQSVKKTKNWSDILQYIKQLANQVTGPDKKTLLKILNAYPSDPLVAAEKELIQQLNDFDQLVNNQFATFEMIQDKVRFLDNFAIDVIVPTLAKLQDFYTLVLLFLPNLKIPSSFDVDEKQNADASGVARGVASNTQSSSNLTMIYVGNRHAEVLMNLLPLFEFQNISRYQDIPSQRQCLNMNTCVLEKPHQFWN